MKTKHIAFVLGLSLAINGQAFANGSIADPHKGQNFATSYGNYLIDRPDFYLAIHQCAAQQRPDPEYTYNTLQIQQCPPVKAFIDKGYVLLPNFIVGALYDMDKTGKIDELAFRSIYLKKRVD